MRTFAQRWVDETLFYRSGGYVAQTVRWLDAYVSPAIGDMQLDEIHPGDVLAIIKARADTAVTAERIRVIAFPSIFRGSVPMGDVTLNQLTASNPKCNTSSRKVRTCKSERDQQLQPEDRMTIASTRLQASSTRAAARMLGRSESTISREIARNAGSAADYASHTAQAFCAARRRAARPMAKLDPRGLRWDVVRTLLGWKCSPQQIAATLARVFPDEPDRHVSHETIYTTIYAQPRGELRRQLRRSLTYDQGKELARHKELTRRIGVAVYFCDPHSPWQRGTCENTNGLLRQYLPKGTDLGGFSQDDLEAVADSLNTRPRATHAFNTPLAVFRQMLALTHEPSPSAH